MDYSLRKESDNVCLKWFDIIENEICWNKVSANYSRGGGIYAWAGKGTIAGNHIWGNFANRAGGAIALHPLVSPSVTKMSIVNNFIEGNRTGVDGQGGGIFLQDGITNVTNNTVVGNISSAGSGGGIALEWGAYADIANNIVADNRGGWGIHVEPSEPNVDPNIVSNDLWNNEAGSYGGILTDQTGINGNISADPCFVTPGYWDPNGTPADANDDYWLGGDYHITQHFSPCWEAGSNSEAPDEDFEGDVRPSFTYADIGADEVSVYDFTILFIMADYWLIEGPSLLVDVYKDDDDIVNLLDFAVIALDWSQ